MAIDSSIAMGVQPMKIDSPVNALAQILQVQNAQQANQLGALSMQAKQREYDDTNKLNQLYSGALGADGKIDRAALYKNAASGGLGSKIPGLQKGFLETDESQGKVDAQKFKLASDRHAVFQKTLAALAQEPGLSKGMVVQAGQGLVQQGLLPLDLYETAMKDMPDDPVQLRARITQAGKSQMSPEQIFTVFAPKPEKMDNGQQISFRDTNPNSPTYGQATGGAAVQRQQTPESVASNATTMRGQNMTDARSRESNSAAMGKPFEVTGPDGTPMLVRQDKQGNISRVEGFGPKAGSEKPMTDAQSKAALFGARMESADKILGTLASQGTKTSIPGAKSGYGIGAVVNVASSAQQQQLEQAKRDFVNAVLRRESGAVISDGEFANADKQYFPQVGDSAAVVAQKASNRAIATRGIQAEVPKAQRSVIKTIISGDAAPNIDSLLDKYK